MQLTALLLTQGPPSPCEGDACSLKGGPPSPSSSSPFLDHEAPSWNCQWNQHSGFQVCSSSRNEEDNTSIVELCGSFLQDCELFVTVTQNKSFFLLEASNEHSHLILRLWGLSLRSTPYSQTSNGASILFNLQISCLQPFWSMSHTHEDLFSVSELFCLLLRQEGKPSLLLLLSFLVFRADGVESITKKSMENKINYIKCKII